MENNKKILMEMYMIRNSVFVLEITKEQFENVKQQADRESGVVVNYNSSINDGELKEEYELYFMNTKYATLVHVIQYRD